MKRTSFARRLSDDSFVEAVAVVIADVDGTLLVRAIEWLPTEGGLRCEVAALANKRLQQTRAVARPSASLWPLLRKRGTLARLGGELRVVDTS